MIVAQVSYEVMLREPQLPALSLTNWEKIDWQQNNKVWNNLLDGMSIELKQAETVKSRGNNALEFQAPDFVEVEPAIDLESFCERVNADFYLRTRLLEVLREKVQLLSQYSHNSDTEFDFVRLVEEVADLSHEIEGLFPSFYRNKDYELLYFWQLKSPDIPEWFRESKNAPGLFSMGDSMSLGHIVGISMEYLSVDGWEWSELRRATYPEVYDFEEPQGFGSIMMLKRKVSPVDLCLSQQKLKFRAKVHWVFQKASPIVPADCSLPIISMKAAASRIPDIGENLGTPIQIKIKLPDFDSLGATQDNCSMASMASQVRWQSASDFSGETTTVEEVIGL